MGEADDVAAHVTTMLPSTLQAVNAVAYVLYMFYFWGMEDSRTTNHLIADLIQSAPAWVRVGITAPTSRVRKDAIASLADHVAAGLAQAKQHDHEQMRLPL